MASGGGPGLLGSAYLVLTAKLDPLTAGLSLARSIFQSALNAMQAVANRMARTIFAPFQGAIQGLNRAWKGLILQPFNLQGGLSAGVLTEGLKSAVSQASALQESMAKVQFTFKGSAAIITGAADEMALKFGINKHEFLDSAASFGLIAKGVGYSRDEAAKFGVQFTKLAADMSSFDNIPVAEAMAALQSALSGEVQTLRRYGVMLNEASINSEGLAQGAKLVNGHLSAQARIAATTSLIMKGLADRTGDLERTSGSYANITRAIQGRLENLAGRIGEFLVPTLAKLNQVFGSVLQDIEQYIVDNRAAFDAWANTFASAVDYLIVAVKEWPVAWDAAVELAQEKAQNLKEIFQWLADNMAPAMQRVGEALIDGLSKAFKVGLQLTVEFAKATARILANPAMAAGAAAAGVDFFKPVRDVMANAMGPRQDFTALELSKGPEVARNKLRDAVEKLREDNAKKEADHQAAQAKADRDKRQAQLVGWAGAAGKDVLGGLIAAGRAVGAKVIEDIQWGQKHARKEDGGLGGAAARAELTTGEEIARQVLTAGFNREAEQRELKQLKAAEEARDILGDIRKALLKPGGFGAVFAKK